MGPVQDSPYLSSIEGTIEQEIYAVRECLPFVVCLCCHGKSYGISIGRAAPQCIQHLDRIGRSIEVDQNTFELGSTQFFNNSVIPPVARTSIPSSRHTAVKAVTKNGSGVTRSA
jgi:hypothetical protein